MRYLDSCSIKNFSFYGAAVPLAVAQSGDRGIFTAVFCEQFFEASKNFDGARLDQDHFKEYRCKVTGTEGYKNNVVLHPSGLRRWTKSLQDKPRYKTKYRDKLRLLKELPKALDNYDKTGGDWPVVAASEVTVAEPPEPIPEVQTLDAPIIAVPFHGVDLIVAESNGNIWVATRRICEIIGLNAEVQRQMLSRQSWARTSKMLVRLPDDDRPREHYFLHISKLPMWLGRLDQDSVKEEFRPFLQALQNEACEVLDRHFNNKAGRRTPDSLTDMGRFATELAAQLSTVVAQTVVSTLTPVVDALMARVTVVPVAAPAPVAQVLPANIAIIPRPKQTTEIYYTGEQIVRMCGMGGSVTDLSAIAVAKGYIGDSDYGFAAGSGESLNGGYWETWKYNQRACDILKVIFKSFRAEGLRRRQKKMDAPIKSALEDCKKGLKREGVGTWTSAVKYYGRRLVMT